MTTPDVMTDIGTDRGADGPGSPLTRRRAISLLGLGSAALLAGCSSSTGSGSATSAGGSAATTADSAATTAGGSAATTAGPATTAGGSATTVGSATTASSAAATTAVTSATTAATAATTTAAAPAAADLSLTPRETAGPFPADGSNDNGAGETADMLADRRTVRSDIRADLDGSNVQEGVPMTLAVTVLDDATGKALSGAAVYIWHCNKTGVYSQYNSRMLGGDYADRSYLRGVQLTDANGIANFQTILPGRYQGRAFHIHFEVFADGTYGRKLLTSQIAVDDDQIDALYADAGYSSALRSDTDNARDGVFRDGVEHQLMKLAGSVSSGLAATFTTVV